MKLHELRPNKGAKKNRTRVGRGYGSGKGKTCGRGEKGQKCRSGAKSRAWFEGGQMPLQRRLPIRGFKNPTRVTYQVVNLSDISARNLTGEITPEILKENGLINSLRKPVKVLGNGDIEQSIEIKANAFSKTAVEKIEKAGGKATTI
jgi:large subunit ribosomal protein L15